MAAAVGSATAASARDMWRRPISAACGVAAAAVIDIDAAVAAVIANAAPVPVRAGIANSTHTVRHVVRDAPPTVPVAAAIPEAAVVTPVEAIRVEHRIVVVRDHLDAGADVDHRGRTIRSRIRDVGL